MANTTDTSQLRGQLATRKTEQVEQANGGGKTINDLINDQRDQIARALPKHMDADRLARIALTSIRTTPQLLQCSQQSLLGALMLSAQTGLEPGPLGHAYFVPRRIKGVWECQWMLGYKGIVELARRSGQILSIEAREVCENDEFSYAYGLHEELSHKPYMQGDRGPIVAVWAMAKFKDGGHYFVVLSRADIDQAKKRSDAGSAGKGPWASDYAAMARKTAIRRMQPYLPLSAEQASLLSHDETVNTRVTVRPDQDPAESTWLDVDSWEGDAPAGGEDDESVDQEPSVETDTGEVMSAKQRAALHALLKAKHGVQSDDRFPVLSAALGREVASTNEITADEAGHLIEGLQELPDLTEESG